MKYNPAIVSAYFQSQGLYGFETEYSFHPIRRWRFDYAWPTHKVALEVEGGIWTRGAHGRPTGIVRDIEKYNEAARLGWLILRVEPKNLCLAATAQLVKETLLARPYLSPVTYPEKVYTTTLEYSAQ